ncbi:MAG: DUF4918 family protein [Flavobacteriales bacterium]|nr:DUF4918 family protein [Flavobacteriales bacterium]
MDHKAVLHDLMTADLAPGTVPEGVRILRPFSGEGASEVRRNVRAFHEKFFGDRHPRLLLLGINPGRLGAGSTGIAFTDSKRCESDLGLKAGPPRTHEPSSEFFYRMIRAAGGASAFYRIAYVTSVCPLGFTAQSATGNTVNLNYYDRKDLQEALTPFIEQWLTRLSDRGFVRERVICIGTGKNYRYLNELNDRLGLFGSIIPIEHPRYIMQYRSRAMKTYIDKYLEVLGVPGPKGR